MARSLVVVLAILSMAACTGDGGRRVVHRLADEVWHSSDAAPSTAGYPYMTLGEETRALLTRRDPSAGITRSHFATTLDLPRESRLEFAYALLARTPLTAPVFFTVTIDDGEELRKVFEASLSANDDLLGRWFAESIDLSNFLGEVAIEFQTSSDSAGIDPASGEASVMPFFSAPVITAAADASRPRNLLLISLDTLRADRLGAYGYERDTSPRMDRIFEREGLIVDRVLSNATNTLYGHAAMLFGMRPSLAMDTDADAGKPVIVDHAISIAEALRAAGYRTAAFTENAFVAAYFGFARGFEIYREEKRLEGEEDRIGLIEETFAHAGAWLERHREEPFFLFVHTYQVHNPYTPPPPYDALFPTPPAADAARVDSDLYDREIAYTDAQVGALLDSLDETGVLDDTLVVITSDHGEEFGEHGYRYHGPSLHDEVLRVPLLLRAPGLLPEGDRAAGPMSLAELSPTLLELLAIDRPASFEERSLATHLTSGEAVTIEPIFSEAHAGFAFTYEGKDESWMPPAYAATLWPHRLIRLRTPRGARIERYDLEYDPRELDDVSSRGLGDLDALVAALEGYRQSNAEARRAAAEKLASKTGERSVPVAIDEAVEEKLRALGYFN